MRFSRKQHFVR